MLSETSDFRDLLTLLVMIRIGLLNERQTLFCRSLSLFLFFAKHKKKENTKQPNSKNHCLFNSTSHTFKKLWVFRQTLMKEFFFLFLEKKMFGLLFFYF
jgi:hypothetical protein